MALPFLSHLLLRKWRASISARHRGAMAQMPLATKRPLQVQDQVMMAFYSGFVETISCDRNTKQSWYDIKLKFSAMWFSRQGSTDIFGAYCIGILTIYDCGLILVTLMALLALRVFQLKREFICAQWGLLVDENYFWADISSTADGKCIFHATVGGAEIFFSIYQGMNPKELLIRKLLISWRPRKLIISQKLFRIIAF